MGDNIKPIIKIQRYILLKKFYEHVNKNIKLFELLWSYTQPSPKYVNNRYEELRDILKDHVNIQRIDEFLGSLYRYYHIGYKIAPRINSRKLLIAWIIVAFPEYTLGMKNPMERTEPLVNIHSYPNDIFFICKEVITYLRSMYILDYDNKENLRKFKKSFNTYTNAIIYFLKRDKDEYISKLITEFISINKTVNEIKKSKKYGPDEKEQSIEIISTTKSKIVKYLKQLDSTIELADLEIYSKINSEVTEIAENAMYDIILGDIKNKKVSYFSNLVDVIVKNMIILGAT